MQAKSVTTTKTMSYQIHEKPDGGFSGVPSDPSLGTVEGATREEVLEKIEARLTDVLQTQLPHFKFGSVNVKLNRKIALAPSKEAEQMLEELQQQADTPLSGPLPIAPAESGNKVLRFVFALIVAFAVMYYIAHR